MIRPDQIPDEVVEAAAKAAEAPMGGYHDWIRAAIAAARAAWPGAGQDQCDNLILPLPPEGGEV